MDLTLPVPVRWHLPRSRRNATQRGDARCEEMERGDAFPRAFHALAIDAPDRDSAGFGCCGGMTSGLAGAERRLPGRVRSVRRVAAFDPFAGLSQPLCAQGAHQRRTKGEMAISLAGFHAIRHANRIAPDDHEVNEGHGARTWADASPRCADNSRSVARAHIDCDLHRVTPGVLRSVAPLLSHGMSIVAQGAASLATDAAADARLRGAAPS